MKSFLVCLVVGLILIGCRVDSDDVSIDAGDTDTAAAATPPRSDAPGNDDAGGGNGDAEHYVSYGACPFECCVYREWTLETPAAVRTSPTENASVAFELAVGDAVTADSGHVRVIRPGAVVADRAFPVEEEAGSPTVAAGDTLYLLHHLGEGFYKARYRGEIYETSGSAWFGGGPPGTTTAARLIREPETRWWAHVTLGDGRTGWVLMDEVRVGGADACA